MKNLTSIAEHSDWLDSRAIPFVMKWQLHRKRVEFGKQKLALWMFVPCKLVDGVWVVLEEPKRWKDFLEYPESFDGNMEWYQLYEYQLAKERCLFYGFESIGKECIQSRYFFIHFIHNRVNIEEHFEGIVTKIMTQIETIEDLVKYNLELTPKEEL